MSELIVVAFDGLDEARRAMKAIRELEREDRVHLEDSAIIERDPDGTAHVRNEVSGTTETTALIGAILGGVVGFAFPPAGIALGAVLGAAVGSLMRTGVESKFIDDLKGTLTPGRSALFLVVEPEDIDALVAALRPFRGELIQTTLPSDAEQELKQALAH
jgi:uncharacterized membrane protein